jgi:hypothetical protein
MKTLVSKAKKIIGFFAYPSTRVVDAREYSLLWGLIVLVFITEVSHLLPETATRVINPVISLAILLQSALLCWVVFRRLQGK